MDYIDMFFYIAGIVFVSILGFKSGRYLTGMIMDFIFKKLDERKAQN